MINQTVLIIDDEKMTHVVLRGLLGDEYNLEFAYNAQEGINILAEKTINLILLDIQMPELSGFELLESLMIDTVHRNIPVIIITGSASAETESRAKKLGACDFIDKTLMITNKNEVINRVRGNIVTRVESTDLNTDLKLISRNIASIFMSESIAGDFFSASRKLGSTLMHSFDINYISLWGIFGERVNLVLSLGREQPENFGPEQFKLEKAYTEISVTKKPYLTNNAASENSGIFSGFSMKYGLSSEIGVPVFELNEHQLIQNKMKIPPGTPLFGIFILKRNRVFTTKEYTMISRLLIQSGTVLYRLYKEG
jgi:CheY-like chemotaxis protein